MTKSLRYDTSASHNVYRLHLQSVTLFHGRNTEKKPVASFNYLKQKFQVKWG